jgi:hypothetical protein
LRCKDKKQEKIETQKENRLRWREKKPEQIEMQREEATID